MHKKLGALLLAFSLLFAGCTAFGVVIMGEGEIEEPAVPSAIPPEISYAGGVFTVTKTDSYAVRQIGYALYAHPITPSSLPVLEGHLLLSASAGGVYQTGALDTSGTPSGKYVLRYWLECKGSRSIDIVNLDLPSPKNTVYIDEAISVQTRKVSASAENRAFGGLMVVAKDNTPVYNDSKRKEEAAVLDAGDAVEIVSASGGTARIRLDGRMYYARSSQLQKPSVFAKENPDSGIPILAAQYALNLRGSTYVYGGEGAQYVNGRPVFDCSGLTYYAYKYAGLEWRRMAAWGQAEYQWFQPVWSGVNPAGDPAFTTALASLLPGDLIFFQSTTDPGAAWRKYITHCGMYVGSGFMVHAGDPVHVESVESFAAPVAGEVETVRIRAITRLRPAAERIPIETDAPGA